MKAKFPRSFAALFCCPAALAVVSQAQTSLTLDGTSGSNQISSALSTNGGLNLDLGFFVEYLVVGGGGGGGTGYDYGGGGGGGAGGLLQGTQIIKNPTNFQVTVGAGGAGGAGVRELTQASNGGNSAMGDIIAIGGGGAGGSRAVGLEGGSGGGAGGRPASQVILGGGGTVGQGNTGGTQTNAAGGAGGGGAGSSGGSITGTGAGPNLETSLGAAGGAGLASHISGATITYAAGGAGGGNSGQFGGANASANTGNGGNGASSNTQQGSAGGSGGSGIVIARYQGAQAATGGTISVGSGTASGYTVHTFTDVGNSNFDLSGVDMNARLGATITSAISGNGNLSFAGTGRLTLNAANTYTGQTIIEAGTLLIGSNGSIANSSGIHVESGAQLDVSARESFTIGSTQTLSGGGTITGNTTISGTHTPGFSPGIQTFDGNLSYTVGSSVVWELIANSLEGRGTNYDGINVTGDLTFTGSTTINLAFALAGSAVDWLDDFWAVDRVGIDGWKIFDVTGSISGFEFLTLDGTLLDSEGAALSVARSNASFFLYESDDGIYLNYSAIPEPSVALLGLFSSALLLRRKRIA